MDNIMSAPSSPLSPPSSPSPPQGFSSVSERVTAGATVWGASHLPQNREVFMVSSGDGTLHLYKYHYPDQRRIKDHEGKVCVFFCVEGV